MPDSARSTRRRRLAAALLALAGLALLTGLGDRALWDDEAETALLARRALEHGLPYAVAPGEQLISQAGGREVGWNGLWVHTPWAQIYAAAASLTLFGDSAFGARALFALIGLASLGLFYRMAEDLLGGEDSGALTALFLAATSVPLLLQFRQCRWYALAFLAFTLWWWGYWRTLEGRKGGPAMLAAGMTGLFYTQQLAFAAAAGGFFLAHLAFYAGKTRILVKPVLWAVLLCLPWLLLQTHASLAMRWPLSYSEKVAYYISELNAHHLPLALLAAWAGLRPRLEPRLRFALLFLGAYLLLICGGGFPSFYRYLIPILPAVILVEAAACRDLAARLPRPAGLALIVLLSATNLTHRLFPLGAEHSGVRFPWADFARELSAPFEGPLAAVARTLNERARPGDVVWISYGDLPLRFHTRLTVHGGLSGADPSRLPAPDWIILRRLVYAGPRGLDGALVRHARRRFDLERDFERLDLAAPDVPWDNRSEPDHHWFVRPEGFPPISLFRRVERRGASRARETS